VAAPLALVAAVLLVRSSAGHVEIQVALAIYGTTLVLLFAGSATLHLGRWRGTPEQVLLRIDHSNIFLVIAGSYTPVAVALLAGSSRALILAGVWALALCGVVISVFRLPVSRRVQAGLYLGLGWVGIFVVPQIATMVGRRGIALIAAGGTLYTLGALCYAARWPNPWRRVFGYHEVFHLLVIAASALFVAFMALFVVPGG
jgi:hemolysin III